MTKIEKFEAIIETISKGEMGDKENELIDFCAEQIGLLKNKAQKAKDKALEKKENGDALRQEIQSILTDEYQLIDEIQSKLTDKECSKAKIVARLGQLVKMNIAERTDIKTEEGTLKGYKLV